MRFWALTFVSLAAVACSTLTYQEPTSGSLARVRFVSDLDAITVLRTYDDESCESNEREAMRLRNGYLLNSSPKRLGIPLWNYNDNAAKEVYVTVDKQFNGLFKGDVLRSKIGYTQLTSSCAVPFFFTFREHTDYEVLFHWYSNTSNNCTVTISQVIDNSSGAEMKELANFTNRVTDTNRGCIEESRRKRLY